MRVVLDTHAFLWFVLGDPHLSNTAQAPYDDPENETLRSAQLAIGRSRSRFV